MEGATEAGVAGEAGTRAVAAADVPVDGSGPESGPDDRAEDAVEGEHGGAGTVSIESAHEATAPADADPDVPARAEVSADAATPETTQAEDEARLDT